MKKKVTRYFKEHPTLLKWKAKAKATTLPGFHGASIYDVFNFFFKEIAKDQISMRAAAVSFYFLMAIFPSIIFLFTLIPYIPIEDFSTVLFNSMDKILPHTAFFFLQEAIEDIVTVQRGELLSFGILLTFYFSTSGVNALINSFNKVYPIFRKRSFLQQQVVVIKLSFLIILLTLASVALIIIGDLLMVELAEYIRIKDSWEFYMLQVIRWVIIVLLFFTAISFIYFYGPATHKRWRFVSAGSTVATILTILTSLIFAYAVNNYDFYNKIYGSIGALVAIILWIYLNTLGLLIGFELNASINFQRNLRAGA